MLNYASGSQDPMSISYCVGSQKNGLCHLLFRVLSSSILVVIRSRNLQFFFFLALALNHHALIRSVNERKQVLDILASESNILITRFKLYVFQ